jgi:S-(hydroxymethyl)glutathione dehydrogenase/alcohol dehydrogenase
MAHMRAALLVATREPLEVHDVEVDAPRSHEVLVRTVAAGVCHSELHIIDGLWGRGECPMVLGHESAGIVERVGAEVRHVKPGDRVLVTLTPFCGTCARCAQGQPAICLNKASLRRPDRVRFRGQPISVVGTGAFAEFQLVDASACVLVPDEVPFDVAALISCCVVTGVGAVVNTAKVSVGSTVVVIGCGGVGLNVVQGARLAGASRVIAIDLVEHKLRAAQEFGATDVLDGSQPDLVQLVQSLTQGGVDFAFEAIGLTRTAEQAYAMLRPGGTAVVVGVLPSGSCVSLPAEGFMAEKRIFGTLLGSSKPTYDFPWLMQLYLQKRLKVDELISRTYKLSELNDAYAAMKGGEVNRSVVLLEQ